MVEVLPTLLCAPLIARLIFDCDQRVGTAAPLGAEIDIAPSASSALLDMRPPVLDCF